MGHIEILKVHSSANGIWRDQLILWMKRLDIVIRFQIVLYSSTFVTVLAVPIVFNLFFHQNVLFIDWAFPRGFELNTNSRYLCFILYQLTLVSLNVIIVFVIDLVFLFTCINGMAYIDLIRLDYVDLKIKMEEHINDVKKMNLSKQLRHKIRRGQDMEK